MFPCVVVLLVLCAEMACGPGSVFQTASNPSCREEKRGWRQSQCQSVSVPVSPRQSEEEDHHERCHHGRSQRQDGRQPGELPGQGQLQQGRLGGQ